MIETISPPEVPRVFLIPVDALYSGLMFLFSDRADVERNEQDARAFSEMFQQTAIHLVQKTFAYQNVDPNVFAILQMYQIPTQQYLNLLQNIYTVIDTSIHQIEQSIAMLRYHYVVDVNYQLTSNHTLKVTLLATKPTRDYDEVLRVEVLKARENNEFVPYKYLILAGLA